jgi:hypothetical protein
MQVVTCDADHPVRQPTGELLLRHPAAQVDKRDDDCGGVRPAP